MGKYKKQVLTSIFDLVEDETSILRMPFNFVDYGVDSEILRPCDKCKKDYKQRDMKELSVGSDYQSAVPGDDKLHPYSIFYCRDCWFSDEISDASKWVA